MRSHKILIINWQDIKNPLAGGAERHLHEIFSRLSDYYQITTFVSSFPGAKKEENVDGIQIIRRGSRNNFNFVFYHHFQNRLRNNNYDIIIEDLNKIPFFTPLYSSLPKIAILHHFFGKVIYQQTNPLFASYVYFTERLVGKVYQNIQFIAVSQSTKEDLIKYGIDPQYVTVIYNGVDTGFYHPVEKKAKSPLIISVGRIKKYKAIHHLIYAIKELISEFSDIKLLIIGDGDDRNRLEKIVKNLKLSGNITFTGWISDEQKRELSSKAWFGITTSPKEGFGLVNVEIQACGTPVISASSPGLKESVVHAQTGLLYRYGDIDDLSEKIRVMLKNRNLRNFLTDNTRRFAQSFSWDKSAQEVRKLINQTLTRSGKG